MRILSGKPFLIGLSALVCVLAARASAAPAPALFRLTVSGTVRATWDYTGPPDTSAACQTSIHSQGTRVVRFRSRRPTLVRFASGRVLPVLVRGLAGSVTLTGPNTVDQVCSGVETFIDRPCTASVRSFADGRASVASTARDSLTIGVIRATLTPVDCPLEPNDVVRAPAGAPPGRLKVSLAQLARPRVARITLTATASLRKKYATPEAGTLTQQSFWTLTFARVRP